MRREKNTNHSRPLSTTQSGPTAAHTGGIALGQIFKVLHQCAGLDDLVIPLLAVVSIANDILLDGLIE